MLKRLKQFLPGIFLLGFNIGTGSVTAMAKAGATYGMTLLWTIIISCLMTYFMLNLYSRYTMVTGETALEAFKKHIHPALGIFFITALTTGVVGSVMGVMGIVADISSIWSGSIISGGIAPIYFAIFFVTLVYIIFWNGSTHFFERFLAVIVAIMSLCFLINFVTLTPPITEILSGIIPTIPEVKTSDQSSYLVMASMVGTTVFSGLFIIRTTLVKESGWGIRDFHIQKRDALMSVVLMFVISASIMASASGTLHRSGQGLVSASQMVLLLEPIAGKLATSIFAFGIIAAGVSSQFPNVLMLPWLLCDYRQSPRNMTLAKYRIMVFFISLMGLVVPIFDAPPVAVMIVSQAFNAFILPITVGSIFYLSNRRDLMQDYRNGWTTNLILILIFSFSLFTSFNGMKGVLSHFNI